MEVHKAKTHRNFCSFKCKVTGLDRWLSLSAMIPNLPSDGSGRGREARSRHAEPNASFASVLCEYGNMAIWPPSIQASVRLATYVGDHKEETEYYVLFQRTTALSSFSEFSDNKKYPFAYK
jgi:endogenous inhibitor of DNA gyrase (YacG/DUF329 family)